MRAIALTLSLLATLVACSKDEAPRVTSQGPVVHTETGDVRGTVHSARRVFQGIPYAAAPVGELRWAPPQPAKPWTGERDATKPGSPCPQLKSPIADLSGTNEDCLFLNVTTPARSGEKKPVMVWIHGDGAIGAGHLLDPARLVADGDVVVVTFNFRLGVFGGFGHPELKDSGTIGLQDQRAVLRWVQRNAEAFGGDPGNVTLFGVSYGATSTSAHLMSKESHGLFDKVIMQSGFTLMDMPAGTTYPGLPALPWYGWTTTKDAPRRCPGPATRLQGPGLSARGTDRQAARGAAGDEHLPAVCPRQRPAPRGSGASAGERRLRERPRALRYDA
jgi:para-nitrobenzyl esterase